MSEPSLPPLHAWLAEPLDKQVAQSIERLRAADDIAAVAIMPDVHLASEVCVGAVVATRELIYPAAVGSDIGCGMAALAFNAEASLIDDELAAGRLLSQLYAHVPANKHPTARALPSDVNELTLSDDRLKRIAARDGRVQLGTLGRGNHFLELQVDDQDQLWAMLHSGSRAVGQAIALWHLERATPSTSGLAYLDAAAAAGQAYLADAAWARRYAGANRLAMLQALAEIMQRLFNVEADWSTLIHSDHNHVQRERHAQADANSDDADGKAELWVHRKGAQSAAIDEPGVIPGSMGSPSFHTAGRGCRLALASCSHGAGRRLSRTEASRRISAADLRRQVGELWFNRRRAGALREEAPAAYKDIRQVMQAQRELTKITATLRPLLTYKGL
jgi:tRNA-splicing ligase RtcB